ncbi:MAG TPA: hypothetical protein VJB60_00380 [Candidatus Peribacterales bacterium]|nr:hypothetical protein [Candidatus Peribacterales bacterium]
MNPTHTSSKEHSYSPSYDNKIFKKYSARTLEAKMENKLLLQEELGWVKEAKLPLLCISGGMTDELGGGEFEEVLGGIMSLHSALIVRGIGSEKFGKMFTQLEHEYKHRVKILKDEEDMRRKMYAAADITLFFAPDEAELRNCLAYGVVPISPEQDLLADYNPVQESGNAFIANPHTPWNWFAALVRATETYKLPYDWRTIQKHCMETVNEE